MIPPKNRPEIIIFDMDGVLVNADSSWQFVHKAFHVDNDDNIKRYLNGEIDYPEFMRRDIRLWGRVHIGTIAKILERVPLMKGAKQTLHQLKKLKYKTCILSGGISILAERMKDELGIDHVFANKLLVDESGMLTGEGEISVDLLKKVDVLKKLVSYENVALDRCAIVGDSIYDIPLFQVAGFSIAFNAKDSQVKDAATVVVEGKDLRKILPYFNTPNIKKQVKAIKSNRK